MDNFTLFAGIFSLSLTTVFAQTNSENSNNKPNGTNTGYLLDFEGATEDNCPNLIPYDQYFISDAYSVDAIGNDTLTVSTDGTQVGWHKLNIRLYDGNCNPVTINLMNNQNLNIKLTSTTNVPQFLVMLADVNGNFASNNPPFVALSTGENTLSVTDLDFGVYGSTDKIDSTKIAFVSLFFRISHDDNDGGVTTSAIGTFKVDYIHLGDVSALTSTKQKEVESTLEVYPNPASDLVMVSFDASFKTEVVLSDLKGRGLRRKISSLGEGAVFETSGLPVGLYMISIITEDGVVNRKVSIR